MKNVENVHGTLERLLCRSFEYNLEGRNEEADEVVARFKNNNNC